MNFEDITKIWQYQTNEAILIRNEASLLLIFRSFQKANPRFDQPRRISGNIFYEFAF